MESETKVALESKEDVYYLKDEIRKYADHMMKDMTTDKATRDITSASTGFRLATSFNMRMVITYPAPHAHGLEGYEQFDENLLRETESIIGQVSACRTRIAALRKSVPLALLQDFEREAQIIRRLEVEQIEAYEVDESLERIAARIPVGEIEEGLRDGAVAAAERFRANPSKLADPEFKTEDVSTLAESVCASTSLSSEKKPHIDATVLGQAANPLMSVLLSLYQSLSPALAAKCAQDVMKHIASVDKKDDLNLKELAEIALEAATRHCKTMSDDLDNFSRLRMQRITELELIKIKLKLDILEATASSSSKAELGLALSFAK
ncbi:hypothetical protein HDU96_004871 [Phlyctochytrium bullatum]|nr:hypothetical protein HDU96_004871 [Phlyctochytrium bullatum]